MAGWVFVDIRASRHRGITVCVGRVPQVVDRSDNGLGGANSKNFPQSADIGTLASKIDFRLGIPAS